ncbi:hypothetical protein ACHAW5_001787 [Stephanodiscus triporus]|uniref:Uncharacterized protein n=1 Tax=Stephanodiscus triporus TaxID=2934178 RepID=A0ABD3NRA3_9STRA
MPLKAITKDNMFELRDLQAARLWILPPATMEVVMELLCEDRLAHPQWPHVFAVPRLMTHFWRKDLMKNADLLFTVPAGVPFWNAGQFEPLIVAIVLPLSHVPRYTGPWLVKGTDEGDRYELALRRGFKGGERDDADELHELEGLMCEVWQEPEGGSRALLQQFLAWASNFPPVQKCMEASDDRFPRLDDGEDTTNATDLEAIEASTTMHRYRSARDGDHLMGVPFECDLCSFRNVSGRQPIFCDRRDQFTLTCIRRVQLDVMWAREPHTVSSNWARTKADYQMVMTNLSVSPEAFLPQLGNTELRDRVGMGAALATLVTSLRAGRNSTNIQVDTMRKTRTWISNAHDAGQEYSCESVVGLDRAKQYVTSCHTFGKWYGRFMRGARLRMGMVRKQNEALTSSVALAVCEVAESRWQLSSDEEMRENLEDTVCFFHACSHGGWLAGGGGAAPIDGGASGLLGGVPVGG